jgi:tRNA-specific 2-thiouridylase
MKRIAVAVSGGVDSAVAALLVKQGGFETVGVTMSFSLFPSAGLGPKQGGLHAIEDAARVCEKLGIEHHLIDVSTQMEKEVIEPFIAEYLRGRTPNPCVVCNRRLKFGLLFEKALSRGFDGFATGHYAAVTTEKGSYCLKKPKDRNKDQTYFLYSLSKDTLPFLMFPLADYTKEDVRGLAFKAGFPASGGKESQDVCFMPKGDCREFMRSRGIELKPGDIVDVEGRIMGRHNGIACYTVGQRGGLRISAPQPLYVIRIDAQNNRLIVGEKEHLKADILVADQVNWLVFDPPAEAWAKIRYAHRAQRCKIEYNTDGSVTVGFNKPQEAISPGQSVVFYGDSTVLGGGVIREVLRGDC